MSLNVHTPLVTLRSDSRITQRQREILGHLTWETPHLVSHYLTEGGLPFDFQAIYYRLTDRFDYASVKAGSLRRTLRTMEGKGLLLRGSMLMNVNGCDQPENIRRVAGHGTYPQVSGGTASSWRRCLR